MVNEVSVRPKLLGLNYKSGDCKGVTLPHTDPKKVAVLEYNSKTGEYSRASFKVWVAVENLIPDGRISGTEYNKELTDEVKRERMDNVAKVYEEVIPYLNTQSEQDYFRKEIKEIKEGKKIFF
ncbi:hypothetical protein ACTFR8_22850 [Bacillus cereus group sp. MYBK15-3]|uniref:hypothetical protein n=1 Tax=Bacillus cereus group TaxID=86661 RepID=UPI001C8C7309|nr:hypothetical protein [Bacillus cereus]MBX9158437.1 hypothetical protein [Bacillus cereus]